MKRIAIIGTGYVGLVTGACFAAKGLRVDCVDLDPERVAMIHAGRAPFFEQGLEELLAATVPDRLRATLDLPAAVAEAEAIVIAVGTPFDGRRIDLSQVRRAAEQIGEALRGRTDRPLVMVKSTVLPGTTDHVVGPILERASGLERGEGFSLGMNPEFLREGQAVADFMTPDRVVMGGVDERSRRLQEELYADFPCSDVVRTDNTTAEAIKYASNSLLATLISFSNEIADLCAGLPGVDVEQVLGGVHLDKRLSPILDRPAEAGERLRPGILAYLAAGCGFGGSCLPKDVRSFIAFGDERGSPMNLLRSVIEINQSRPIEVVRMLEERLPTLDGAEVAVLGLAFKPGTSDIRETPALPVIRALLERGARVRAYDPAAVEPTRAALAQELEADAPILFTDDLPAAVRGATALAILTAWPELRDLPALVHGEAEPPLVVDGRRALDPDSVPRYAGIGLGPAADRS